VPDESQVGLVHDDRYLQHNPGVQHLYGSKTPYPFVEPVIHPSNYRLVMRSKHLMDYTGLSQHLLRIPPYLATDDDLAVYHTAEYIDRVKHICSTGGGDTGEGAPAAPDSLDIARLAAGGGMAAVDAVMDGTVRRAFANIRPPGHHAMSDKGMGFCIFNNVVVAARHAQRKHGIERVMVLDWDVHDGNGTQDAFYRDPTVLFFSIHQDRLYPRDFGLLEQIGEGEGEGFNVNLPLPAGSGDATYLKAIEEIVLPIADQFKPELVLISAGQDASTMDPLGRMCVTTEGYRRMTQHMIDIAQSHADGRLVILQEGGYSETYAPYCTLAIVETLAGYRTGIEEPLPLEGLQDQPQFSTVGASGEEAIAAIAEQYRPYWPALR
jgi:acetoin utilization deacetylase AcuC-like enzyme